MGLELIVGPPNSGRTGAILDRFTGVLEADPLLVVPTSDDVDRFERELCERPGSGIGGSVTSFPGLFGEVARAYGTGTRGTLSRMQRVWICRAAARDSGELRILARSARSEGFAPALEGLISELQGAGLDAHAFGQIVAELEQGGDFEGELVSLFAAYERRRDGLGLGDEHTFAREATAALRSDPGRWERRPVLLYGFDDLSREQIELIGALAAAAPVTAAIAWEPRAALGARAELLGDLREELGGEVVAELEPDSSHTDSATLFHLERHLFEAGAPAVAPDGALRMLVSAGERGEAELIGRRIARLIADGTDPDRIAVAVRSPDRQAPLLARVLGSLGVPVAAEARVGLPRTATGSTLLRILALAAGEAGVGDLLAYLRGPARAAPSATDWFERQVVRGRIDDVDEAIRLWEERAERPIWGLSGLRDGRSGPAEQAEVIASLASDIAEYPHRRSGIVPAGDAALELRAAAEVRRACSEAAALGADAPAAGELAELLRLVRVPLWRGPTEGRVRILSPYRLRATRVFDLFVAGLTDGSFPGPGSSDPLLSDERRRELGIRARRDAAAEERYLFYSCVSRPERTLHLSWPATDESGGTIARSPFVDEVRELLDPPPDPELADDPVEAAISHVAGLADIAVEPELASSPRDLRRALAVLPASEAEARLGALRIDEEVAAEVGWGVASARARAKRSRSPGPLSNPFVLSRLGERELFGASTLEQYDVCSYMWFVNHELRPARIEPDPEPLETGGIIHAALEALYRDPPAGARPATETLEQWTALGRRRLREAAEAREWDLGSADARINLHRLDAVLEKFLRRDAETGGPMVPRADLLEAAFGSGEDDTFDAVRIGSFLLHGRIDRVDVSSDGKALVRDYKLSKKATSAANLLKEGKLQLPLYMEAVKAMGLEPIGGVYHPLGGLKEREDRPRGMLAAEHRDSLIPGHTDAAVGNDFLDDEEFEQKIAEATARAQEIVDGIRAGAIDRNPREGSCPAWCRLASVCRMERGVVDPDEDDEDEGVA